MKIDKHGFIVDEQSGLTVPRSYARPASAIISDLFPHGLNPAGYSRGGTALYRDKHTYAVKWEAKGSGLDDLINRAIADGNIKNVGVSPVIAPQISALIRRQQSQAVAASLELTGRKTPVKRAKDAISRFNDSPLGVAAALEKITHDYRTYNRGCPISTVPIMYDLSVWDDYGMTAQPIAAEGESESAARHFVLDVDYSRFGTPTPFLPDPLDLEPTGNPHYPYWYYAKMGGERVWVLLPSEYIMPLVPGETSRAGVGTSSVWLTLGYLAETILVLDQRLEQKVNAFSSGLVLIKGMSQTAEQIEDAIHETAESDKNAGFMTAKSYTLLVEPMGGDLQVEMIPFRQPDGIEFETWRAYEEDVLALAFDEPLSSVVTRGGVGYGAQAETIADNAAEAGVGVILHKLAQVLGAIYPRVMVTVTRHNDRAQRLNVETFNQFAEAVGGLPEGTLTRDEIRAMIDRDILQIPETGDDSMTTSTSTTDDESDEGVNDSPPENENLARRPSRRRFDVIYDDGIVRITDDDIDAAIVKAQDNPGGDVAEMLVAEGVD